VVPDDASRRGAVFVSGLRLPDMSILHRLVTQSIPVTIIIFSFYCLNGDLSIE
jgi:hypothetical protein